MIANKNEILPSYKGTSKPVYKQNFVDAAAGEFTLELQNVPEIPEHEGTPADKPKFDELLAASGTTTGLASSFSLAQEAFTPFEGAQVRVTFHTIPLPGAVLNVNNTGAYPIQNAAGIFPALLPNVQYTATFTSDAYVLLDSNVIGNGAKKSYVLDLEKSVQTYSGTTIATAGIKAIYDYVTGHYFTFTGNSITNIVTGETATITMPRGLTITRLYFMSNSAVVYGANIAQYNVLTDSAICQVYRAELNNALATGGTLLPVSFLDKAAVPAHNWGQFLLLVVSSGMCNLYTFGEGQNLAFLRSWAPPEGTVTGWLESANITAFSSRHRKVSIAVTTNDGGYRLNYTRLVNINTGQTLPYNLYWGIPDMLESHTGIVDRICLANSSSQYPTYILWNLENDTFETLTTIIPPFYTADYINLSYGIGGTAKKVVRQTVSALVYNYVVALETGETVSQTAVAAGALLACPKIMTPQLSPVFNTLYSRKFILNENGDVVDTREPSPALCLPGYSPYFNVSADFPGGTYSIHHPFITPTLRIETLGLIPAYTEVT